MSVRFLLLLGLVALLGAGSSRAQSATATGSDSGGDHCQSLEQEAFHLINTYRKGENLPPLHWDSTIAQVARDHSRDMATGEIEFGHAGFRERVDKLGRELAGLKGAGENVLESGDLRQMAQIAVGVWLKSPPHLKNIRGDYNYSGLGVWQNKDGTVYFTQIFLKLQPTAQTAQAAPPPGISTPFGLLAAPNPR